MIVLDHKVKDDSVMLPVPNVVVYSPEEEEEEGGYPRNPSLQARGIQEQLAVGSGGRGIEWGEDVGDESAMLSHLAYGNNSKESDTETTAKEGVSVEERGVTTIKVDRHAPPTTDSADDNDLAQNDYPPYVNPGLGSVERKSEEEEEEVSREASEITREESENSREKEGALVIPASGSYYEDTTRENVAKDTTTRYIDEGTPWNSQPLEVYDHNARDNDDLESEDEYNVSYIHVII